MTSPIEMAAMDHEMAAEDDADMPERMPDPVGPLLTGIPQPAASAEVWPPDTTAAGSPAAEPEVAGQGDAEESMTFAVPDAEAAEEPEVASWGDAEESMALVMPDAEPASEPEVASRGDAEESLTFVVPDVEPASIPESPAASTAASLSMRWHEILAMFVDDPRSSAELAAGLVDDSIQALVASLKEQQDSLLAAWHGEDAGTEELRTAVQQYRAFGNSLADFPVKTEPLATPSATR
jgi:hypothetical protein